MFGRSYPIRKVVCNVDFFGFHSAPPTSLRRRKRSANARVCVCACLNRSPPRLFHIYFLLRSIFLFAEHCVRACDCRCAKRRRCCARCVKANRRQKKTFRIGRKENRLALRALHGVSFHTVKFLPSTESRARVHCHTFPLCV